MRLAGRRNAMVHKFGCGIPVAMTRAQLDARVGYLRARGRHFEALDLLKEWLAVPKERP